MVVSRHFIFCFAYYCVTVELSRDGCFQGMAVSNGWMFPRGGRFEEFDCVWSNIVNCRHITFPKTIFGLEKHMPITESEFILI